MNYRLYLNIIGFAREDDSILLKSWVGDKIVEASPFFLMTKSVIDLFGEHGFSGINKFHKPVIEKEVDAIIINHDNDPLYIVDISENKNLDFYLDKGYLCVSHSVMTLINNENMGEIESEDASRPLKNPWNMLNEKELEVKK